MRYANSLLFRLSLILLLPLIPLTVLLIYSIRQIDESIIETHRQNAGRLAFSAAAQNQDWVTEPININRSLATSPLWQMQDYEALSRHFGTLKAIKPNIHNILAVDDKGKLIADINGVYVPNDPRWQGRVSFGDRQWFKEVMAGKEMTFSKVIMGRLVNKPLVAVAVPVKDEKGTVVGAISVGYSLRGLDETFDKLQLEDGDIYLVMRDDGSIYHSFPKVERDPKKLPFYDAIKKQVLADETAPFELSREDGSSIYFSAAAIRDHDITLYAVVGIDSASHNFDDTSIWLQLAGGIVLFAIVTFLMALVLAYFSVAAPGKRLMNAAIQMDEAQLISVTKSKMASNEMRVLAKAFQNMTSRLFSNMESLEDKVSELDEANSKLNNLVRVDALTGAYSRRHGLILLGEEIHRFNRYGIKLSVLIIDLDHFKKINDQYGHGVGDTVLQEAANYLSKCTRANDHVIRYAGDEFMILLSEAGEEEAKAVCDKIVGKPFSVMSSNEAISITFSIGGATFQGNQTANELIDNADEAMYQAKQAGRNGYQIFTADSAE